MKLMLHVAPGIVRHPLIASVILETSALVNIQRASIDAVSGEIVLEVPVEKFAEVKQAFERRGVKSCPWKYLSSGMKMNVCIVVHVSLSVLQVHFGLKTGV